MQRKNSILKHTHSSRSGMALIMAIAVIVIISTILALSLSLTATTSKKTTDLYLYEQTVLLSKSATEYALLKISQSNPCTYTGGSFVKDTIYNVNIAVSYVYDDPTICSAVSGPSYTTVTTPEQSGSALINVTISVTDSSIASEPLSYFRRTLQKL